MADIPSPKLILVTAEDSRREHDIDAAAHLVLGSSPSADLVVEHPAVAGNHARLYAENGHVYLEDLGSGEGTFVDGQELVGPLRLRHGQQIDLGAQDSEAPVRLRYEDPASQLLEDLGLLTPVVVPKAERPAETAGAERSEGPRAGEPAEAASEAEPVRTRPLLARHWLPAIGAATTAGAVLLTWWLLGLLQPSTPFWRSVQVMPLLATPSGLLTLQSPDIEPRDALGVTVAGLPAQIVAQERGALTVRLPELPARSTGLYDVPLAVQLGDLELYQRVVRYAVHPSVLAAEPTAAMVGDLLVLTGKGFTDERERVTVRFGNTPIVPERVEPERLEVRVPAVARLAAVEVPVEVQVDEWTTTLPDLLRVLPRSEQPLAFRFAARFDAVRGAWRIGHPFGPAFYFPGADTGDGTPPDLVALALERWDRLFDLARENTTLRVDSELADGLCSLTARGRGLEGGMTLITWRRGELARLAGGVDSQLSSELVCAWMAGAWNHFLDTFSRGKTIPANASSPAYVQLLNRLVATNRASGGDGRPEQREIDALPARERRILAQALYPPPKEAASLAGNWIVQLEGLPSKQEPYRIEILLALWQQERTLTGDAVLSLKGEGLEMNLPPAEGRGTLQVSSPPRMTIEFEFNRPIGKVVLQGTLTPFGLEGTYTAKDGRLTGRFRGVQPLPVFESDTLDEEEPKVASR
jgi:hypothetical protein